MLAASCEDLDALRYPLLATPKIDGIRCLMRDGVAYARSLKPIPNLFIQRTLSAIPGLNGCDGELLSGKTFQQCTGDIMRRDGEPAFTYHVFDYTAAPPLSYRQRAALLEPLRGRSLRVRILTPVELRDRAALDAYLESQLAAGQEGIMVRDPSGPYKHGRATFREGWLTKIKPFEDDEAVVIGYEEQMHNANEAIRNALGRTARSTAQSGLVPAGTLGALRVRNDRFGEFTLGTGFDAVTRDYLWNARPAHVGRIVKFKYQAHGTKDKPRIPSFQGFRNPIDL